MISYPGAGYTQSGPLFRAKTRALEKAIIKAFPGTTLTYPTGPLRLDPSSIPGFTPLPDAAAAEEIEAYGWWRRKDDRSPVYDGFDRGLAALAECVKGQGPFDGVMGFSQGGAAAAMLAALLDGRAERRDAFQRVRAADDRAPPFPDSFLRDEGGGGGLLQAPLKFAVVYSGFQAPPELYGGFYEPKIGTPTLHFFGGLDTVVSEERGQALVDACDEGIRQVVVHPGGHFVPSQRVYLDTVVAFITKCCGAASDRGTKPEEKVEDMEVPF